MVPIEKVLLLNTAPGLTGQSFASTMSVPKSNSAQSLAMQDGLSLFNPAGGRNAGDMAKIGRSGIHIHAANALVAYGAVGNGIAELCCQVWRELGESALLPDALIRHCHG
jgi:hypothetical protein